MCVCVCVCACVCVCEGVVVRSWGLGGGVHVCVWGGAFVGICIVACARTCVRVCMSL